MRRIGSIGCLLLVGAWASRAETPAGPESGPQGKPPSSQLPDAGINAVSGSYAYRTYCASCHGSDGKGEGPLTASLRFHPPDLTLLAKRNGGDYPTEKVHRIVDGRKPLPGHGGPDMPIWGDAFKGPETGFDDAKVKEKIRSVVDFLRTLQASPK
jgi:mono/diheme cytochrome c family protein